LVWMQLFAVQHLYNRDTWQISACTAQRSYLGKWSTRPILNQCCR
jgi:hypothetical protein